MKSFDRILFRSRFPVTFAVALSALVFLKFWEGGFTGADEPLLRKLPPGVFLTSSTDVPSAQAKSIGAKLGGDLSRLTNSVIKIHGTSIQVNVITAKDEKNAQAIERTLGKIKSAPFVVRKGPIVVEYVGRGIDAGTAIKASYELGLVQKPDSIAYKVVAEIATIDRANYMAGNRLFNQFIALQNGDASAAGQIRESQKDFRFGRKLMLRDPSLFDVPASYSFAPQPIAFNNSGCQMVYSFDNLPVREGVPYVQGSFTINVDQDGFLKSRLEPNHNYLQSTEHWPADDASIRALAKDITSDKTSNAEKALAILQWLKPGNEIKYSGTAGSRWGTRKVLQQKFGHCWDFSDCFVSLARASGIPARQVAGWLFGSSGHVWAEYYDEQKQGWVQVDATGGGELPCGLYHIPFFTSDNGEMPIVYLAIPTIEMDGAP